MDNCNTNRKNVMHTRSASFQSKNAVNFKEQNGLKRATKIAEKHHLKPYPVEEYLTAECSKHLQNILSPKTKKQANINDKQYEDKQEYSLLQRQKQSPFFYPSEKMSSLKQQQNTKSCFFSGDSNNEVPQFNKDHNQDSNYRCLLPQILPNHGILQTFSTDTSFYEKSSDYNTSMPAQHYMLHHAQGYPQKRRHQQSQHHHHHHHHHNHHNSQQQHQQHHKQRYQLKSGSLHNHIFYQNYVQHPSLYDIYNHDIYKTSNLCRSYKSKVKEHFSSNKPYPFSASNINQNSQTNSYNTESIQQLLLEQQEPYYNITSVHDTKTNVPTEYSVENDCIPLNKWVEPTHENFPCAKDMIEPSEVYGNLLKPGFISSETVSSGVTEEAIEEPELDFKKDTTPPKDESLKLNPSNWQEYKTMDINGLKIGCNIQVMYTSESEAKMNAILPIFNKERLTVFPNLLIENLYDGKQCSTCGRRSSVIDREHMDKHFRQNELKTERRFLKCRNWYENVAPNIEEQQQRSIKNINSEEKQVAKKPQLIPGINDMCSVCKESFMQFYNQEDEEWQLKDAVVMDNQYFHEICSEDRDNM
ncbi:sex-determining region Y protein isoform X2 [Octopus bimaculoides]|uniref:Pcf11 C-terminal domain-containing protein n=1 Tax=Octopus bimaculoides TaxID=37653 RepID=A0A0L8GH86_OCTBM|nr:sex-determining region Y protein isoform X2 [Octopus bimaculoides]|eukprot:XP_014781154.1 PREDICTED: sex-determining region Y protein-like isoform X2 [Octopus bimaculoides]